MLALPTGGRPYSQRRSPSYFSPPQSDTLQGGVDLLVRVLIPGEGVGRFLSPIGGKPADGRAHGCQPPSGGVLSCP